jgi:hypothetical protein
VTDKVTLHVGDRYDRIVKRRLDVNDALRHHPALFPLKGFFLTGFCLCLSHVFFSDSETVKTEMLLLACSLFLGYRGASRPLASSGVGMSALAAHRKSSSVSQTAVTSDIHQPLYVHLDLLAQIAFHHSLLVDNIPDSVDLFLRQLTDSPVNRDPSLPEYLVCARTPNSVDVGQSDFSSLIGWKIYSRNSCHCSSDSPQTPM